MTAILFTLAAMSGALVRVVLRDRFGRPATTWVNLLGSFLLGLILAAGFGDDVAVVIGTGFCGSLTTMSGLVLDSHDRAGRGGGFPRLAIELLAGLAAAAVGFFVAT